MGPATYSRRVPRRGPHRRCRPFIDTISPAPLPQNASDSSDAAVAAAEALTGLSDAASCRMPPQKRRMPSESSGTFDNNQLGSPEVVTPGRIGRGRAKCQYLSSLMPGNPLQVEIVNGDGVGPNGNAFTSYLGIVARAHVPIDIVDYRRVSDSVKNDILLDLSRSFTWDRSNDDRIIQHAGELVRKHRHRMKKMFFDGRPLEEAYVSVPDFVNDPIEWKKICDHWNNNKMKSKASKNKANRDKLDTATHRLGRKNLNQLKHNIETTRGHALSRPEIFEILKSKSAEDGTRQWLSDSYRDKHEQMVALMSSNGSFGVSPRCTPEEAFVEVMGNEHPGRVRCGGRGHTISKWYGARQKPAYEELRNDVKNLKEMMAKMQETQELLLAQLTHMVTKENNARSSGMVGGSVEVDGVGHSVGGAEVTKENNARSSGIVGGSVEVDGVGHSVGGAEDEVGSQDADISAT